MPLSLLLYPMGRGYKEVNRVSYNIISIRSLSLLTYFTYIFLDIIIYVLESTSWSSGIFQMVGRVIADPSFDLLSLYVVVPWVLILINDVDRHLLVGAGLLFLQVRWRRQRWWRSYRSSFLPGGGR
jgi:hypothetical protein